MTQRSPAVLYIVPSYPSPSQTFIAREVLELERRGWEVGVAALNPASGSSLDPAAAERTYSLRENRRRVAAAVVWGVLRHPLAAGRGVARACRLVPGDIPMTIRTLRGLVAALAVVRHCRRRSIGHVHAHLGGATATVALLVAAITAGSSRPITYSLTIHGWHEFADEHRNAVAAKVAGASFIACISDFTRSQLMRIAAPEHWDRIAVVRCGLDFEAFESYVATPNDRPTIVIVARLSPEKGHMVLLDAVTELGRRGHSVDVRVVGGGDFEPALRDRVAVGDLEDQVVFLGTSPNEVVRAEVANADVFCLPSFAEGLPVALMEAMALETPVVTTAISGTPELVVDGVTGDLVAAGRSDLLADRIERLLTDPDHRARVVSAAKEAVAAQHDIEQNVDLLEALLHDAVARVG